jgi:hypothetical protein
VVTDSVLTGPVSSKCRSAELHRGAGPILRAASGLCAVHAVLWCAVVWSDHSTCAAVQYMLCCVALHHGIDLVCRGCKGTASSRSHHGASCSEQGATVTAIGHVLCMQSQTMVMFACLNHAMQFSSLVASFGA